MMKFSIRFAPEAYFAISVRPCISGANSPAFQEFVCCETRGTDYHRAEWNLGTFDRRSILTWGPFGATVGWGGEVQAILRRVDAGDPALLESAFGEAAASIRALLDDRGVAHSAFEDPERRTAWKVGFARLGREAGNVGHCRSPSSAAAVAAIYSINRTGSKPNSLR